MINLEALKGINAYPIPLRTVAESALRRGVDIYEEFSDEMSRTRGYNLCKADLLMWLSYAPAISQGGQSYSFTEEQRLRMRNEAKALYDEYEDEVGAKTTYGYKGKRL